MAYIGNTPALQYITFAKQTFTADSSTVAFTLDNSVANENELEVFVNNVRQEPGSGKAYTASGTTLTMSEAPTTGDDFYCIYQGKATQTVTPGNGTVTNAHLAASIITGQTALGATPADTDELLISDAGTLKRVDFSHLKVSNTPAFVAYKNTNQTISNTTVTKITFEAEQVDSGSVYDTSNSRFTPGETGYYWIGGRWRYDTGDDFDTAQYRIYKNGSIIAKSTFINQASNGGFLNMIIYTGSASDYYEMYGYHNRGSSTTINGDSTYPEQDQAQFYAFKIIGL